jgi:cytochrome c-type biogenesis protein CcmH
MNPVRTPAFMILAAALALGGAIAAAQPALEAEARAIEATLIAPCCWSQQVSLHHSAAADEIRRDVRSRLARGETRQQILDAYVARYGKRILVEPPAEGPGWALYALPAIVFAVSAALLAWVVMRFTTRGRTTHALAARAIADEGVAGGNALDRLDEELRNLD